MSRRTTKKRLYRVTLTVETEVKAYDESGAIAQAKDMHGGYLDPIDGRAEEIVAEDWPEWVPEHMREPMVEADFTRSGGGRFPGCNWEIEAGGQ